MVPHPYRLETRSCHVTCTYVQCSQSYKGDTGSSRSPSLVERICRGGPRHSARGRLRVFHICSLGMRPEKLDTALKLKTA